MSVNPYQVMIDRLDELVKSRFIEMFGTLDLSIQKSEWKELGSLGKILTGSTPKTNVPDYWDGEIKWVTPAELGPETCIINDTERKITEAGRRSCSLNVLKPGVVLLTSRAPIGKVAIVGSEMYCNQGFKNIECGPELNNVYLYTLLRHNTDFLNSLGRGATFKEVSAKIVSSIKIPTPPREEQDAFATFVEQVDKSKAILRRMKEKYDLLVKSRFIEMFGTLNLSVQKSGWKELGSLGKILTGSTPKTNVPGYWDGEIKWVTPAELGPETCIINDTERKITEAGRRSCSLNVLRPGVVLLTSRAPIGKVAIVGSEMYCNQGFKNIECGPELNNVYLYTLLKHNTDFLNSLGRGATFKEISAKIVSSIKIPTPPREEQDEFATFVEQVDKTKFIQQRDEILVEELNESRGGDGYDE